jgi:Holliday junction resolvasome RuvABC endonuclease subunit
MKIWGMDLSLNHGAIVQLENGKLDNFWFWTTRADVTKLGAEHAMRMKTTKGLQGSTADVERLSWIQTFLSGMIRCERPKYAALEDYAYGMSNGAHQIGEVGGMARLLMWDAGVKFRLHDPGTVKMYAAHDGAADKTNVRWNVQRRWKVDFDRFIPEKKGKTSHTVTAEDLCDAMALAQLCRLEVQLRAGKRTLQDLKHDHERRVFNRVTKAYPVNILGRDWIRRPYRIAA